jgi:hypothetical protein
MATVPPTVVSRARHRAGRLTVSLVDLAADDEHPIAVLEVRLPSGTAAVIEGLRTDPGLAFGTCPGAQRRALAERLLAGCADALRASGRRRVTVSLDAAGTDHVELLAANGYVTIREHEGRLDMVLEL